MSEELKQESVEVANPATDAPKPKQYLVMADELHMGLLSKLMPGILFVQVEGMGMQNNPNHMLLVNPIKTEAPVTQPIEPAKAE